MVFFAADTLPPSARRVLNILVRRGPLTHKDLVSASQMPPRTVRFALARLRTGGHVSWRWSLRDARQRLYFAARGPSIPPPQFVPAVSEARTDPSPL